MFRLGNRTIRRIIIALVTVAIAVVIIEKGAAPRKYRLEPGESSRYDITAPRDIVNVLLTEKLAAEAAERVPPVMLRLVDVPIDIINAVNEFTDHIEAARQDIAGLYGQPADPGSEDADGLTERDIAAEAGSLVTRWMKE